MEQLIFNIRDDNDVEALKKRIKRNRKHRDEKFKGSDTVDVYDTASHEVVAKCNNCLSLYFVDEENKQCPVCGETDFVVIGKLAKKKEYNINVSKREINE